MVDRGGRNDVFRFPRALCQRVQRFLSAADDCFVASDSSWSIDRIPESHQKRSVGSAVGFSFLRIESATGGILRSGAGQRSARRPAGCQRLFFRAAVDQFPPRGRNWNLGLVHDSRRRARFARAGDARRALGANENQWRSEFARGKTGWASLVGRDCFDDDSDGGDIQGATSSEGKLHDLARGICFPAACSLGNRRSCFRIAKTQ